MTQRLRQQCDARDEQLDLCVAGLDRCAIPPVLDTEALEEPREIVGGHERVSHSKDCKSWEPASVRGPASVVGAGFSRLVG